MDVDFAGLNTPRRVLVVDDEPDIAESLAMILRHFGYQAEYVTDPLAALGKAREMKPEVALLDLGMPRLSGFALARLLRSDFPSMLIVAVSGHGTEEDRRRSAEAGFNHHLMKPADPAQIAQLIVAH